jgi:hypothetical protein
MLGHNQKQKTTLTRKRKVMIVKTGFFQDSSQVIVKVIAVLTRRPVLNKRQSMPKITIRENKKKGKQQKRKSDKQKKKLRDLLGLPHRMLFKPQLQQLQPMPLQLVHLIQHRPMHRQQMQPKTRQLILQLDAGHQEGYIFTMLEMLPEGGHQELSEMRHYQRDGGLLVQKFPFQRLCHEITDRIVYDARGSNRQIPIRFQTSAIMVLQEAE